MIGKFERESNFPPDKTSCCRASQIFKELAEGNLILQRHFSLDNKNEIWYNSSRGE
jgi:hypothetical protein